MGKLKIEHGASRVRWVLLKTSIEEAIATDIDLLCQWSQNDRKYIVNQLLRFALEQSTDFQKYKSESHASSTIEESHKKQTLRSTKEELVTPVALSTTDHQHVANISKERSA